MDIEQQPNIGDESPAPRPPAYSKKPQARHRQGKASKQRRQDKYRTEVNVGTLSAVRDSIRAKYAINRPETDLSDQLAQLNLGIVRTSRHLPITLRCIGLIVAGIYRRIASQFGSETISRICGANIAYRVSIAQATLQIYLANKGLDAAYVENHFRQYFEFDHYLLEAIEACGSCFTPIASVVQNIGKFEHQGNLFFPVSLETYHLETETPTSTVVEPAGSKRRRAAAPVRIVAAPTPAEVNFCNLRTLVERLSNPATPRAYRQLHRRQCSLPTAEFDDQDLLLNPDEIMPMNYSSADFHRDVVEFRALLSRVSGKIRTIAGTIQFNGKGSPSQLCYRSLRPCDETLRCDGQTGLHGGDRWDVLVNDDVNPTHFTSGCFINVGEINPDHDGYSDRSIRGVRGRVSVAWLNMLTSVIRE